MTVPQNTQTVLSVIEDKNMKNDLKQASIVIWCKMNWKKLFAELISTILLLVFGCLSCLPLDGFSPIYAPLGFGLTVMINVQIFGHISGAHMNPAVTLAALICGDISFVLAIGYAIVQVVGSILGYGIVVALSPIDVSPDSVCCTLPHANFNVFQALGVEIVITAALSFLYCAVGDPVNRMKQDSIPIKFGLTITGLSLAGAPLTGASMNPVRSLGPSFWTGNWTQHWVYWVGPMVGAAIAAIIYKFIWLEKIKEVKDDS